MRIKMLTPGINICITKDNVKVTISSAIAYRITNPIQVNYILGLQLNHALVEATHSSIRNIVGESNLD
jgi:regulator of protease activity HflC (stomatin/prohibitin superfamily)